MSMKFGYAEVRVSSFGWVYLSGRMSLSSGIITFRCTFIESGRAWECSLTFFQLYFKAG